MRRTSTLEAHVTAISIHPHAEFDRFPHFLSTIREEFPDDCEAIADEMIEAELGDFCWDSRIAERQICVLEPFDDDEFERKEVRILGYFRGECLVATCIVDADHRLQWMPKVRRFGALIDAETAFLAAD
jgi:hypothetical protein